MLVGMRTTERITVTLPTELTARLRQRVSSGEADSVSGFVAEAVTDRLREESLADWLADMADGAEPITDEARDWAENVLRSARGE